MAITMNATQQGAFRLLLTAIGVSAVGSRVTRATTTNAMMPNTPIAASASSSPAAPQRVCAQPSTSVMYAIGMFDSEA